LIGGRKAGPNEPLQPTGAARSGFSGFNASDGGLIC
jgi:hypothetical protein